MENQNQDIIKNTDGTINLSSSATLAASFSGEQINSATHQASYSDIFDTPFINEKFDLMGMLTGPDYYFPATKSIFDVIGSPSSVVMPQALEPQQELFVPAPALGVPSEINNTPATPENSSMVSWSSNETVTEDQASKQIGEDGEEKVDDKNKKLLKPKNMRTKKKKEPRVAFKTVSDIDNMDDGYKWRKYGQKAVKNSPFPRNYYRCTGAECGVKKRVERSSEDSSIVVTTYEGTHNHICPMNAPRGIMGNYKSYGFPGSTSGVGGGMGGSLSGGVGSGNFSSGIGGGIVGVGVGAEIRASLSSAIGGNVSNGTSGHGGGSIGGKLSSGYDGSGICGIGGCMAAGSCKGRMCGASDNIGGASGGIVGSFGTRSGGSYAGIGSASGGIGGASGGIVGSFGTGSGGSYAGIGSASGGRFMSGNGGRSFNYGLGGPNFSGGIGGASGSIGSNFSGGIGGASGSIGSNFSGGGSFSSGISTSFKGNIVDNIEMISDNAYKAAAIGNSSIGSPGGHIGSGNIKSPYAIEQLASYQQPDQQEPHLYNNPSLSSHTFGAANVGASAAAAAATTSSATVGFGSSSQNNDFFSLEMYEQLAILRQQELLEEMLAPQMQQENKKDQS